MFYKKLYSRRAMLLLFFISIAKLYIQIDTEKVGRLFDINFKNLLNKKVVTSLKFLQVSAVAVASIKLITVDEIKHFG